MGTWSVDAYGNDEAVDWSYSLENARGLSRVDKAIDIVLAHGSNKYLDASDARVAIAAMEALTRLAGRGGATTASTRTVDEWAARTKQQSNAGRVARARKAIRRILADSSELKQLWKESGDHAAWLASVRSLERRLAAPPRRGIKPIGAAKTRPRTAKAAVGDLVSIRISPKTFAFARIINIANGWDLLEVLACRSKSSDVDDAVRTAPALYPPVSFAPSDVKPGRIEVRGHGVGYSPGYVDRLRYVAGIPRHYELLKVNHFKPVGTVSDEEAPRLPRQEFYDFDGMVDRIKARLKSNIAVTQWLADSSR